MRGNFRFADMTGAVSWWLTATSEHKPDTQRPGHMWLCNCVCGKQAWVKQSHLKLKLKKSCGCWPKGGDLVSTHGLSQTPEYSTWRGMIDRAYNLKNRSYHRYGGRGIKVCRRWLDGVENFIEDMGLRPRGMSLDRIDNDGDYEPSNCRWATHYDQARNKATTYAITYDSQTLTAPEWEAKLGFRSGLICERRRIGWTDERILSTPSRKRRSLDRPEM